MQSRKEGFSQNPPEKHPKENYREKRTKSRRIPPQGPNPELWGKTLKRVIKRKKGVSNP